MLAHSGTFDASTMVVSVRKGSFANRADDDVSGLSRSRSETDPYPALYIEDPFDRTNNVARNVRPDTYRCVDVLDVSRLAVSDSGCTLSCTV